MENLSCHRATIKVAITSEGKVTDKVYRVLGNCVSVSYPGKGIEEQHLTPVFLEHKTHCPKPTLSSTHIVCNTF